MADIYQGDPRLFLTADGSKLNFVGGQPTMDRGLENLVLISLFTAPDWPGNDLFNDVNQRIGSDFEEIANQPITIQSLNAIQNAAERALQSPVFGTVTVEVNNPSGYRIDISILIEPPGFDARELLVTKNGINWTSQANDPAHRRA
jgi:hypothetical protein